VTDMTGAVIAGAKVTITDTLTNADRETQTNAQAPMRCSGLNPEPTRSPSLFRE
jgi:hypothetical protein